MGQLPDVREPPLPHHQLLHQHHHLLRAQLKVPRGVHQDRKEPLSEMPARNEPHLSPERFR